MPRDAKKYWDMAKKARAKGDRPGYGRAGRGLITSQIKSYAPGEHGAVRGASECFTLVFEGKREGRRKAPAAVMWHVYPTHVNAYYLRGRPPDRIMLVPEHRRLLGLARAWKKKAKMRDAVGERIAKKLSEGEKIKTWESLAAHPQQLVDAISEHLGEGMEVTVVPGVDTFDDRYHMKAMGRMMGVLFRHEGVKSVRTKGIREEGKRRGASIVLRDGRTGKINREMVGPLILSPPR